MPSDKSLKWSDSYELGIKKIDKQHKQLFILVERLETLKDDRYFREEMRNILYEFREYMVVHFRDEEEYMEGIGFPELQRHKELHKKIIDAVSDIMHKSSNLYIIKSKLKFMAKRVIVNHIINEDMKIKEYQVNQVINEEIFDLPIHP